MSRLLEILDKNFPKFDVTMKIMFVVQNSYLRKILEIPLGHDLPLGFPDFEQTEVDALVRRNGTIFHVEFQSWNDPRMPFRMLDYRNSIHQHFGKVGKRTVTPDVVQKVVYVGSPAMRMPREIKHTGLCFSYSLHDVREFRSGWRNRLLRSRRPLDWILAAICSNDKDELKWRNVAELVRVHIGENGIQSNLALPAVLLVAATLRNMSDEFRKGIINMFTMNIENDPLFREIYDQGNTRGAKARLLRMIGIGLDSREIELDERQNEELAGWKVEDLDELADAMMAMIPDQEILALLPKRVLTSGNSNGGP